MRALILVAAGKGERMGLGYNKIKATLDAKPMWIHSLEPFMRSNFDEFIVVINKEDEATMKSLAPANVKFVLGGNTRQESVYNGIKQTRAKYVYIHDDARPMLKETAIMLLQEALETHKAASLAVPVVDTLVRFSKQSIDVVDRNSLFHIQTPQAFIRKDLISVHQRAIADGYNATDDLTLFDHYYPNASTLVKGDRTNIKVTTQEDLSFWKAWGTIE